MLLVYTEKELIQSLLPASGSPTEKPRSIPQCAYQHPNIVLYKNAHPRHFCVCVYALLKCRFWGGFPVGASSPLSFGGPWLDQPFIVICLWWLMKKMSFTVRLSHCFPPHHQLLPCIIVHKSFFLFFCSPLEFSWSLLLPGVPWPTVSLWAVCWSRSDVLLSQAPARVWSNIGPYFSALSLAPGRISGPFSNKASSCS